jgi:hypothetical protein
MSTLLRQHAEQLFAQELEELQKQDSGKRPQKNCKSRIRESVRKTGS